MLGRRREVQTADENSIEEAYRILRSNLQVVLADLERTSVIVTSAAAGEGKSSTCANLAMALARVGSRVVVADVDLRNPSAHTWLGGHNEFGVSDVLLERIPLADALQYIEVPGTDGSARGLYLLARGAAVSSPTELLSSNRMARLLDALEVQTDVVLLDTPPVLPVADTLVIGRMAAGAILVVEAGRTPITAVQNAKDALTRNQTRLLGLVINRLDLQPLGYYGSTQDFDFAGQTPI
jgi:capsular exopolysaccharide synthesis family protein